MNVYSIYRGLNKTITMLPFVLVLLVAHGSFAAPTIQASLYNVNEVPSPPSNGQLINANLVDSFYTTTLDGGDVNPYLFITQDLINDYANLPSGRAQASAALQILGLAEELTYGIPGDSCQAAALINAYVSGNSGALRSALANYVQKLASSIDTITQKIINPNGVKYLSGPKGSCLAGGRNYQFEAAWEAILTKASNLELDLLNQEYCALKRLYASPDVRNNNAAASLTAATIEPVNRIAQRAAGPLAQFLRVVAAGGNPIQAGAQAKVALVQGLA